jgi:hypothetical protein
MTIKQKLEIAGIGAVVLLAYHIFIKSSLVQNIYMGSDKYVHAGMMAYQDKGNTLYIPVFYRRTQNESN